MIAEPPRPRGRLFLLMLIPSITAAQVGHPPGSSPYHDIAKGHSVTFFAGNFGGDGGRFGIAPHDGTLFGLRYDIRVATPLQIGIMAARGNLDRFILDPTQAAADRVTGPVEQTVSFAELDLQLNLTGGKSWHRLAPFVGAGGGLTFPTTSTPEDLSGFKLGHKFYFVPTAGTRIFLTDRLHLRGEARVVFWKLKYPVSFEQVPSQAPNEEPVISDGRVSEWTTSSWLQAGLGYSFSP